MKKVLLISCALLWLSGCATTSYQERTIGQGAAIGATTGAVIGAQSGNAVGGAVLGGALGALTGAVIADQKLKRNRANARQNHYDQQQRSAAHARKVKSRDHEEEDD